MKAEFLGNGQVVVTFASEAEFLKKFGIASGLEAKPQETQEKSLALEVTDILHNLGIPAHIRGFNFLREAIILSVNDQSYIQNITKALYPTIARENSTTPSRVERAIRHAIEISFSRSGEESNSLFSYSCNASKGKPTNSEFIATIADVIRLRRKHETV